MRKLLAIVAALILVISSIGASAEVMADHDETMSLTVGVTSRMSGFFFTEKWGTNTSDVDLRELIHGHNMISWEQTGNYAINTTVVRELEAREDGGDKVYKIALNDNLAYNDGSPITAWDYAFSALLLSSIELEALGGAPTNMNHFKGYEAYREGHPFAGVHVVDERTMELTIDGRYLPYFYEIVLLNLTPYPIHVIAPGCEVKDDGDGAYITGPFTQELLRETILDEQTGYLYHPDVAAGPYRLKSFDVINQVAQFEKNPYYTGNFEGVVPTIDEITVVCTNAATALGDIESGKLDLINKVSDGSVITEGFLAVREDRMRMQSYLRSGLSFIAFACELGPTQSVNVRKAVAHCVDVERVNTEFTQGYGQSVYGFYGLGQWMAVENQEALEKYAVPFGWEEAAALFEEDGWTLNEAGETFDPEHDDVRYRMSEDGAFERLTLKWAQAEETALSDILENAARPCLEAAGAELIVARLPFDELLAQYYRQTEREYNMISIATNFSLAFDPYFMFHTGDEFQGEANKTGLIDEELMNLALKMRQTEVDDVDAYVERWFAFQDRISELQPVVPLYSNVYFDFFRPDLQNYQSNAYFSWATAIAYAYIGEEMPEEEEDDGTDMEFVDDEEGFEILD